MLGLSGRWLEAFGLSIIKRFYLAKQTHCPARQLHTEQRGILTKRHLLAQTCSPDWLNVAIRQHERVKRQPGFSFGEKNADSINFQNVF